MALSLFLATVVLAGGCGRAEVSPHQWRAMSGPEKEMVVRAQLGAEAAAEAKGGGGRRYPHHPTHYVDRIDRLYAAGESRTVQEIWPELAQ